MKLVAFVAGVHDLTVAISAEPDDSVAKMLDQVIQQLVQLNVPHEFSAYSTKRDGQWLSSDTPDYMALAEYDSVTMAQYLTSGVRLDPTRKVRNYFGDGEVPEGIHIVVDWTSASWREYKIGADAEHAQQLATQQEICDDLAKALAIPSMPIIRCNLHVVGMTLGNHEDEYSIVSTRVEPGDTIAKVLDKLIKKVAYDRNRNDYTAYSTQRDGRWLRNGSPDHDALLWRCPNALARYETAEARLDETKTVADYFAKGVFRGEIHVLMELIPRDDHDTPEDTECDSSDSWDESDDALEFARGQDASTDASEQPGCPSTGSFWDLPSAVWNWFVDTTGQDTSERIG
jgi:hypothetical protein